jgi:hypothetical protein
MSKLSEKISALFCKVAAKPATYGAVIGVCGVLAATTVGLPFVLALPLLGAGAVAGGIIGHKAIPSADPKPKA